MGKSPQEHAAIDIQVCQFLTWQNPLARAASTASSLMLEFDAEVLAVRTTVSIDDHLLDEARDLSGITETGPLIRAALEALIQREAALRLARLGGSAPDLQDIPRRRFDQ
jgi:hypothetical protein